MNDEIKKLLKNHIEDLKNNNLDPIFEDKQAFKNYFFDDRGLSIADVKEFLEDQGIDPLKYVTKIPYWYYEDAKLDNLDLSKYTNLKTIRVAAFLNCHIDKDLILPNSIEVVGYRALWLRVSNLYLPDNLKEIYSDTFTHTECNDIIYKGKKYNSDNIIEALEANGVEIIE